MRQIRIVPFGPLQISKTPVAALSIAGSDSGGGAGIAADLRTFAFHGVYGTLALTAVTAQDTLKVHGVTTMSPEFVDAQIDAALGDFPVAAVKTGMLANVAIIERVRERAESGHLPRLVVDPVMVASSGAALVEGDGPGAYRRLLAHCSVVTPNLAEVSALLGHPVTDRAAMADAARALVEMGAGVALVKGGHLPGPAAVDIGYDGYELFALEDEMVPTTNVHGTGCTLSAAIAANLARGVEPTEAIVAAKRYLATIIRASASWSLGQGPGPLDHSAGQLP